MTEAEQNEFDSAKRVAALLLEEKAKREEQWRDNVIDKLESMDKDLHAVRLSTNQFPQLVANIESQGQRIRIIEDFKIKAIFIIAFAFLVFGFLNFAFWKWADHFFK